MNNTENLKHAVENLLLLHNLILQDKGESEEADKIRDELEKFPEEKEWMTKFSAGLYDLVEAKKNYG